MSWAQFSGFPGKVRYHYHTPDGGPPNMGKPPMPLDTNSFNTSGGGDGSGYGFNFYPGCPPFPHQCGPPPAYVPTPPGWYKVEKPADPFKENPAGYRGNAQDTGIPVPPRPPSYGQAGRPGIHSPMTGNRVKEQLAKFPDNKMGYIFPKHNAIVHIFYENIVNKYPPVNGIVTIPNYSRSDFSVQAVPCDMTFIEFIEQIDCKKRANAHLPYSHEGYPEYLIGIQELLEQGDGNFLLGSKIMLTDQRARQRIGEIWPDSVGTAGQVSPRYVVRCPV